MFNVYPSPEDQCYAHFSQLFHVLLCLLFICCVHFCLHFIDPLLHRSYKKSIQPKATTTAWEEAMKQLWAPLLWDGLTLSFLQNQRSMPPIRSSWRGSLLSNPWPCSVTSPPPILHTERASGWRTDWKSQTHGQNWSTHHTGDTQRGPYVESSEYCIGEWIIKREGKQKKKYNPVTTQTVEEGMFLAETKAEYWSSDATFSEVVTQVRCSAWITNFLYVRVNGSDHIAGGLFFLLQ